MSSFNETNVLKELLVEAPHQQQQLQHADHQAALINPFHIADEELLNLIYGYYVHSTDDQKPVDLVLLFGLVQSILKHSIHVVDTLCWALVLEQPNCNLMTGFHHPFSCRPVSEEEAHRTTISILNKLKNYSWEAKAILTLGAFAVEYGEFALLAEVQSSDHLAKLLATLTQISRITFAKQFTTRPLLQQRLSILKELNDLINLTLQVIDAIFELERLSRLLEIHEAPSLSGDLEQIPVDVYWAIITIVVSATQFNGLTCDVGYKQELSYYAQRLSNILSKLTRLREIRNYYADQWIGEHHSRP
ncbi:protein SIEVE ELEMENT OCCLUSION B-like [Quillaja saponaria]|uniref:Protein SIEVE ELEMENT OCCLUSION B-like n=1 Tax=Quillaja saponaria TaxID=32244 RepID=A0AAD7QEB2_QUISA|nr:protein SIEVE ELEMENT OCCLUSION B-like [Quillaja saponaria]